MENEKSNDFPICLMEQLDVVAFQWRQDTSELDQNAIYELLPVAALEPFPGCSNVEAGPQLCGDYKKQTLNFSDWILDESLTCMRY